MAREAGPKSQRSALLRAGLAVAAAGTALAAGGGAAHAAPPPAPQQAGIDVPLENLDPAAMPGALDAASAGALAPVKDFHLNPLAGTGVDPLDNGLGTQVADFQPLSTKPLTAPLTQGNAVREMPLVGQAAGMLPG
ncbi:hypothetical protein [Streptomyces sp. ISL-100]|uniref:hypothetical protein n=1 Tax=Streptomyces sp. ISL-100 TaxID=2819173 RepID=UPI001BE5C17D|nr:hypothetical protein [Streptomyces sp. ISL-100]MBT2395902.1 hypothetical protein [Streptomyces sp. ISL-100]